MTFKHRPRTQAIGSSTDLAEPITVGDESTTLEDLNVGEYLQLLRTIARTSLDDLIRLGREDPNVFFEWVSIEPSAHRAQEEFRRLLNKAYEIISEETGIA